MAFWKKWTGQQQSWGILVLSVWLILMGLSQLIVLKFQYKDEIFGALAIVAGILLLLRR